MPMSSAEKKRHQKTVKRILAKHAKAFKNAGRLRKTRGELGLGQGTRPRNMELFVMGQEDYIPEGMVNHNELGLGAGRRPRGFGSLMLGGTRKRKGTRRA
jgi:hypothetical protein